MSRPPTPLPRRLWLVGAAASLASVAAVLLTPVVDGLFLAGTSERVLRSVDPTLCATAPRAWTAVASPFVVTAADTHGVPYHPEEAGLPATVEAWSAGQFGRVDGDGFASFPRGVLRTGDPTCAFLVGTLVGPGPTMAVGWRVLLGTVVGVGVGFGLMGWFGIVPVTRTLRRVSHAAETVGTAAFTVDEDGAADDLGRLQRALADAHARLVRDAAQLVAQRDAVEEHLSAVAHDVRTPLAALSLAVQSLHQARPGAETRLALQECASLAVLVDNLNQQTRQRIRSGAWAAPFDLVPVLERLRARFEAVARVHDAELSTSIDVGAVWVDGDAIGAERAVGNLLYNAILHGPGDVGLVLLVDGPAFVVEVWDGGEGVPEAALQGPEALRGAEAEGGRSGSGLGLQIVRSVAADHGWTLSSERTAEGSVIRIRGLQQGCNVPPLR